MKRCLMVAFSLIGTVSSVAYAGDTLLSGIPEVVTSVLEQKIKASAQQRSGLPRIRDFKVDWNSANPCLEASSEMHEKRMGVCMVGFGGFQVAGHAAVIVKYRGFAISVIDVEVE